MFKFVISYLGDTDKTKTQSDGMGLHLTSIHHVVYLGDLNLLQNFLLHSCIATTVAYSCHSPPDTTLLLLILFSHPLCTLWPIRSCHSKKHEERQFQEVVMVEILISVYDQVVLNDSDNKL